MMVLAIYLNHGQIFVDFQFLFQISFQMSTGSTAAPYIAEICTDTAVTLAASVQIFWIIFNSASLPYLMEDKIYGEKKYFLTIEIINGIALAFYIFIIKETRGLTDDQQKTLYTIKEPEDAK